MHEVLMVVVVAVAYGVAWIEVRGEAKWAKQHGKSIDVNVTPHTTFDRVPLRTKMRVGGRK